MFEFKNTQLYSSSSMLYTSPNLLQNFIILSDTLLRRSSSNHSDSCCQQKTKKKPIQKRRMLFVLSKCKMTLQETSTRSKQNVLACPSMFKLDGSQRAIATRKQCVRWGDSFHEPSSWGRAKREVPLLLKSCWADAKLPTTAASCGREGTEKGVRRLMSWTADLTNSSQG